jgi:hypothetical protein
MSTAYIPRTHDECSPKTGSRMSRMLEAVVSLPWKHNRVTVSRLRRHAYRRENSRTYRFTDDLPLDQGADGDHSGCATRR